MPGVQKQRSAPSRRTARRRSRPTSAARSRRLAHLEYFHDHVRVERLLFDGTLDPEGGRLVPDRSRPGLGLQLRPDEAERYAA